MRSIGLPYTVLLLIAAVYSSGCGTKPHVPLVIGDSELERPAIKCPAGVVCEVDPEFVTYSKGYMNKIMKTFNRCLDEENR